MAATTPLARSYAELRAALKLAGQEIVRAQLREEGLSASKVAEADSARSSKRTTGGTRVAEAMMSYLHGFCACANLLH